MRVRIGTCGWRYDDWRDVFYPPELPTTAWLGHYARAFDTVECDSAFYRLPARETFEKWAGAVPDGFTMAVKASRFLTHVKRLKDPDEPVRRLLDAVRGLGSRLGPLLLQLPPTMGVDVDRLAACLRCFPAPVRVAVEPRHPSWWRDDVRALLADRGAALVWSDRLGSPVAPLWRTADWAYLRLHEGRPTFPPDYGKPVLRTWLRRLHETWDAEPRDAEPRDAEPRAGGAERAAEAFVYFNNDAGAAAVRNGLAMRELDAHAASRG